jgi:hypothetical protein
MLLLLLLGSFMTLQYVLSFSEGGSHAIHFLQALDL